MNRMYIVLFNGEPKVAFPEEQMAIQYAIYAARMGWATTTVVAVDYQD